MITRRSTFALCLVFFFAACGGPAGEGSPCTDATECADGLRCKDGLCAPLLSLLLAPVDACNQSVVSSVTELEIAIGQSRFPDGTPQEWSLSATDPVLETVPNHSDGIVAVIGRDTTGKAIAVAAVGALDLSLEPKRLAIALGEPASFIRTTDAADTGGCSSMDRQRFDHTATRLADGRVFVVGGVQPNKDGTTSWRRETEIYDPITGLYTNGPTSTYPRRGHTTTLLHDGRLLIAGGVAMVDHDADPGTPDIERTLDIAEVIDPKSGEVDETIAMENRRAFHSATLLDDHTVLIAGGESSPGFSLSSTELFVPAAVSFEAGISLRARRAHHVAVHLGGTDVAFIGGDTGEPVGQVDFILADEGPYGTLVAGPTLNVPRGYTAAAWIAEHETIVVAGGFDAHVTSPELGVGIDSVELIAVDRDDLGASTVCATGLALHTGHGAPASAPIENGLIVAGGVGPSGEILTSADLVVVTGACTATVEASAAPMTTPRAAGVGVAMLGGDVLLSGGFDTAGGLYALNDDEVFLRPR